MDADALPKVAVLHPQMRSMLEKMGGESPDAFIAIILVSVQSRYQDAVILRPANGTDATLHALVVGNLTIIFTVESAWLVVRGFGLKNLMDEELEDRRRAFLVTEKPYRTGLH